MDNATISSPCFMIHKVMMMMCSVAAFPAYYAIYILTLLYTLSSFRSFQKEGDGGGEWARNT